MKKESLLLTMPKLIMIVSLIVCIGALLGAFGYFLAMPKGEPQNYYPINTSDQKIKNYYNLLDQKCAGDSCCLTSAKTMKENNYQEADKNGECPENFKKNALRCVTSLLWCEPMENKIDPMFYCDSNEDCAVVNFDCSSCECDLKAVSKNYKDEICKDFTGEYCDKACQSQDYECDNHNCVISSDQPDTSDWQIYRNEEYGFEFKYPDDWTVNNTGPDMISLDNYNFCSKKGRDGCFRVSIFLTQDENSSSYQKEFEVMEKIITKKKDNKLFVFSVTVEEKAKTILNKAMSTFKFIEIKSVDNWQTYKNEKYNYEINYPETYSIFQGLKQESGETIPVDTESEKIYITNNPSMFFCCEPVYLSIEILNELISEDNFEKWVNDKAIINKDNNYRIIKKEYFDFAGELAYRIYDECGIDSPKNLILLNHEGNTYCIKYDHQSCFPKAEDILSTFKFIEK